MDLRNRWIHFRIHDVHIPDPQEVITELYGNDVLQGKVIDMSDSGMEEDVFVVVKVEGVTQLLIVPSDRILGIL